jgi:YVTN family beta-propeller protein
MRLAQLALVGAMLLLPVVGASQEPASLALEAKIPLGAVSGRIDHLAVDLGRQRLFVAELANDSVGVIDLKTRTVIRTITGLSEPQGVGFVPSTDTLYVANAGDGSVRLFVGSGLAPTGRIDLGADADNIRVDAQGDKVFIGYGDGAVAAIDPARRAKVAEIPLKAHPEGFQLDRTSDRIFVNLPDARQIAVANRRTGKTEMTLPTKDARANFPMAIDEDEQRVLVVFRSPPKLTAFAMRDGSIMASISTCGDADDVFVDRKRHRVYVSCGEGFIDVFDEGAAGYSRIERIQTISGARTSFFVPELDRLFLAVWASWNEPAAIWVFRPQP